MGMMPAWFTTTRNRKPRKPKFRTAEAKQKYEQNLRNWEELKKRHGADSKKTPSFVPLKSYKLTPPVGRESAKHYPSCGTAGMGVATKSENKTYTGTNILGIGTLHKSNAVPIFNDTEAKDIAKMRR